MWSDVETLDDLLNFSVVANIAAQVIASSGEQPISIGVSGDWGAGKSSLSKMIVKSLKESTAEIKYIFIEFDAWLYQGYNYRYQLRNPHRPQESLLGASRA